MKSAVFFPALAIAAAASAVPVVGNVTFEQRSNRKVDITYTLTETPAIVTMDIQTNVVGDVWATIGATNIVNGAVTGDVFREVAGGGTRSICWNPLVSWPDGDVKSKTNGSVRAVVTAWATNAPPDYMTVDLLTGARKYWQSADFVPGGVTSNTAWRTTSLLMRRIPAKDAVVTLGPVWGTNNSFNAVARTVALSNDFYMAVFETTQRQWLEVVGEYPRAVSDYESADGGKKYSFVNETYRDMRPAQNISYNDVRIKLRTGGENTYDAALDYPYAPDDDSFVGRLRRLSGLGFELPLWREWEFACLCGRSNGYWNNGTMNNNADGSMPGRHKNNGGSAGTDAGCGPEAGTAVCGSYDPSLWGIYDMHGNVSEWCVDGDVTVGNNVYKALRGGSYLDDPWKCRPHYHKGERTKWESSDIGFRVVCPIPR